MSSMFDGFSNERARNNLNKHLHAASCGLFSDQSWEGVHNVFHKLEQLGVPVAIGCTEYLHDERGDATGKQWKFSTTFINGKGKETVLRGVLTAHAAGSVADPLDKYDISAYAF